MYTCCMRLLYITSRVSLTQVAFFYMDKLRMHVQIGNVYAHFREEDQAAAALRGMTGRFYAGMCLLSSFDWV